MADRSLTIIHNKIENMQNKHLNHLEDTLLIDGNTGIPKILDYLHAIIAWLRGQKKKVRVTIKYDGSPSVFFGVHPIENKIFVSTKSLLNKKSLYACTDEEVEKYFNKGIHQTLKELLKVVKEIPNLEGIWQGDIMFTTNTCELIADHFIFRHNTLVYTVKKDSIMGNAVHKAQIGLVIHTHYEYQDDIYQASFGKRFAVDIPLLWQPPLEAFNGAYGTSALQQKVRLLEKQSKDLFDFYGTLAERFSNPNKWHEEIMKTINVHIRDKIQMTSAKLWEYIKMIMWYGYKSQKKFDMLDPKNGCAQIAVLEQDHIEDIKKWFDWYIAVVSIKKEIIDILQQMVYHPDISLSLNLAETNHEGFVVSDINNNWIVKLVNREEFSHANFTIEKGWQK
jgi:Family of unknown function (DUF6267)